MRVELDQREILARAGLTVAGLYDELTDARTRAVRLDELRLGQAGAHLDVARAYAATAPPGRRYRLRMAIASLDLLSARLRGHFDGVFEQVDALSATVTGQSSADVAQGLRDILAFAINTKQGSSPANVSAISR